MTDSLLQQGKSAAWLVNEETGAALVKIVADTSGTSQATTTMYDQVGATIAYIGKANAGTTTSAAAWQVRRLTFNAEGDVITAYADGDGNFDNVWDDRATLTYS